MLKIIQILLSELPRRGLNIEESAPRRTGKWTLLKCLELQEVSGNMLVCVDTFSGWVEAYHLDRKALKWLKPSLGKLSPDLDYGIAFILETTIIRKNQENESYIKKEHH